MQALCRNRFCRGDFFHGADYDEELPEIGRIFSAAAETAPAGSGYA
jgi:hypothetical protein